MRLPALLSMFSLLTGLVPACQYELAIASVSNEECLACHARAELRSRKGKDLFIDPARFAKSAHARIGINCTSCHDSITIILSDKRVPHAIGIEPKCSECHEKVNHQYSKSLHAQISKKICYSCHNPHYSVPFTQLTMEDRKARCLKCHDAYNAHRWLPQKQLHFNYLECASCHDMNAEIGAVFHFVHKGKPSGENVLGYGQLAPFIDKGKDGIFQTLDQDGNGTLSPGEIGAFLRKIQKTGFPDATIDVRILVLRPAHNFTDKGEQTRDCSLCHSENARFYTKLVLEIPEKDGDFRTVPVDRQILAHPGGLYSIGDFYLLGESKIRRSDLQELLEHIRRIGFKWIDLLGLFAVLLSVSFICGHAAVVFLARRSRRLSPMRSEDHTLLDTAWHLVHGLCIILLALTGLQLRLPDLLPIFATFLNAVNLHNICGIIVLSDYLFWIPYQIRRGRLRQSFVVSPRLLARNLNDMIHHYAYPISIRGGALDDFDARSTLDTFEKALYTMIMFVLIPGQIMTGMLLYDLYRTMHVIEKLGGLRFIDALHLILAYLIICSVILHAYFHTLKRYS